MYAKQVSINIFLLRFVSLFDVGYLLNKLILLQYLPYSGIGILNLCDIYVLF